MSQYKTRNTIPEYRLQAEQISYLQKLMLEGAPILYAASLEAAKRTASQAHLASLTGMVAGEPDLRLYMPQGKLVFVENKGALGTLSKAQKERIPALQGMGFAVHVVKAVSPHEAVCGLAFVLEAYGYVNALHVARPWAAVAQKTCDLGALKAACAAEYAPKNLRTVASKRKAA